MNKISIRLMVCLCLMMTLFTGCRHKGFCYHHPHGDIHVEVDYDDDNDPDDAELIGGITASRIMVYHQETGNMVLASDIDRQTNLLPVSPDTYHFLAYNAGTQLISFSGRDVFYNHGVTTRECDILEPLYGSRGTKSDIDLGNGQQVVIAAEPIWGAGLEAVTCNLGDIIRLKAVPLHCRYSFEMRDIERLGGVARASAFITGMSRGAMLGNADLHDIPVTVAVPAQVSEDGKSIVGSFMCFGQNPRIDVRHRMGLFLEFTDGTKVKFIDGDNLDVTDQVVSAPNRRRVHIIIEGLKVPETPSPDTGFEITVNPWVGGENLDINVGF